MTLLRHSGALWILGATMLLAGAGLAWLILDNRPPLVTVRWSTASEINSAGFNLYRSDSPAGPFVQVNSELIPASLDPLIGGSYVFTDTQVVDGQTYYYQLEEVEIGGRAARQGTIEVQAESDGFPGWIWPLIAGIGLLAAWIWVSGSRPRRTDGTV